LAAVDDKTGERKLYYKLNGGSYVLYRKPIYISVKKRETFTLKVKSSDALGNKREITVKFVVINE
jgi:hypothetical protein